MSDYAEKKLQEFKENLEKMSPEEKEKLIKEDIERLKAKGIHIDENGQISRKDKLPQNLRQIILFILPVVYNYGKYD